MNGIFDRVNGLVTVTMTMDDYRTMVDATRAVSVMGGNETRDCRPVLTRAEDCLAEMERS